MLSIFFVINTWSPGFSLVGKGCSLSCLHATEGTANIVGATGAGGEAGKIATDVVGAGAKQVAKACKENSKDNDD